MDELTMITLVTLTIAVMEGVKQFGLPKQVNMVMTVLIGAGLAAVAEYAPDTWIRVLPVLTVGLASAGLYTLGKRAGSAVLKNGRLG